MALGASGHDTHSHAHIRAHAHTYTVSISTHTQVGGMFDRRGLALAFPPGTPDSTLLAFSWQQVGGGEVGCVAQLHAGQAISGSDGGACRWGVWWCTHLQAAACSCTQCGRQQCLCLAVGSTVAVAVSAHGWCLVRTPAGEAPRPPAQARLQRKASS